MPNIRKANNVLYVEEDDVVIKYVDIGQQEGDAVLLLHAMLASSRMWSNDTTIIDDLEKHGFRVIAPDLRGSGLSSKPYDASKYGRKLVDDQLRLIDKLKIENVHVVGYSFGSEIAQKFTTTYPDRVKSLCVGGSGWGDEETYQQCYVKQLGQILCCMRICWYPCCCPCICLAAGGEIPNPKSCQYAGLAQKDVLSITEDEMKGIQVPVCAVVGEKDSEIKYMEKLKGPGVVAKLQYIVIPGKDHNATVTDPKYHKAVVDHCVQARNLSQPPAQVEMQPET
jgi:pimeloyl-ACP methyl ester carboxylesterase